MKKKVQTTSQKTTADRAKVGASTATKKKSTKAPSSAASGAKKSSKARAADAAAPKPKTSAKEMSNGHVSTVTSKKKSAPEARPVETLDSAQAAARRLAAAAGLAPLSQRTTSAEELTTKRRRITKSPVSKKQLEEFRKILLEKRAEVLGDVTEMENEALGGRSGALSSFPQHLADQGSDEYDQSLALGLAASQRKLLAEIDLALERIENGTYGICELLGVPISRKRLEATPWARLSLEGAQQLDSYMPR